MSDAGERGRELPVETCADVVCNMRCLWSVVFIALASLLTYGAAKLSTPIVNNCQSFPEQQPNDNLMIVDTDGDVDDVIALMLLLEAEKRNNDGKNSFDVLTITTVRGSNEAKIAAKNVYKILSLLNNTKVPLYPGATRNLKYSPSFGRVFNNGGYFDVLQDINIESHQPQKHAVNAMIDIVNKYPGKVTILCLGPLTNIALAIRLDEDFLLKLKGLIISGGQEIGSDSFLPHMQQNLWMDPEANYIVLKDAKRANGSIVIVAQQREMCQQFNQKWRANEMKMLDSHKLQWLNIFEGDSESSVRWECGDPVAAAMLICPKLVKQKSSHIVVPVTEGEFRGGLITPFQSTENVKTVQIVKEINVEYYKKLLLCYLRNS